MNSIIEQFKIDVTSVYELVDFDRVVLDIAIESVSTITKYNDDSAIQKRASKNIVTSLRNIRDHDSLRIKYQTVFNQCVVLLVSYFGSTINNLFNYYLTEFLKQGLAPSACKKEEIKVSFATLETLNYDVLGNIGELVISSKNISFQDMQSIARAFREWLGYEPQQDRDVNNIILGQACRHVIVHSGGVINRRLTNQIRNANPRDLKNNLTEGNSLQFSPDEIKILGESMIRYATSLSSELASRLPIISESTDNDDIVF
jgi:hypothetical protein